MLVPMNDVNPYAAAAHIEVLPLTPTRQSIERALVEWMTQTGRPASDLSVSALCKKAFVARSTFYANYRHMGQVYESVENRLLRQLFECAVPMRVRADGTDETMRSFNAFVKVLHAHENEFRLVLVRQPSSRFVALWKQSSAAVPRQLMRLRNGVTVPRQVRRMAVRQHLRRDCRLERMPMRQTGTNCRCGRGLRR